jgi:arylsulfatase A-like enzyme
MPNQTPEGYDRPKSEEHYAEGWKPWDTEYGGYWKGGKHWSEVLGDDGVAFIEEAADRDEPFFMYLAFNAPHDPRQSPKEYVDQYPLESVAVPETFLPEYPHRDDIGCSAGLRDEALAPFPRTEYAVKVNRQEYYAIITHMDAQVGRILDALEASGRADNTYVLFSADHGLAVGEHGLVGKQNMFEHSTCSPLIIAGPGIPEGETLDTPIYIQDVMPTTLELAGAPIPDYVEFRSVLPLIRGEVRRTHRAIYAGYIQLQRMVRKGDYKLIWYPTIDKKLLFDLARDPGEMHDLSEDPACAQVLQELTQELRRLQRELDDPLTPIP